MKCPSCGTENPDHAFYCGKCAAEMRGGGSPKPQSSASIEKILSRNLTRIDENIAKKRSGFRGRFSIAFNRPGHLIVFESEREVVTLSMDEQGHASVTKGCPPGPILVLEGPHESIVAMFRDERHFVGLSDSVSVFLGDKVIPDRIAEDVVREMVSGFLQALFQ